MPLHPPLCIPTIGRELSVVTEDLDQATAGTYSFAILMGLAGIVTTCGVVFVVDLHVG
jgi:hypothetical protein